jgi:rod shape-determining protein MreC
VKSVVETAVTPIRVAGSFIATPVIMLSDFFEDVTTDAAVVDELRNQNEELQSLVMRMEEYRQENERLSDLLELKEAYNLESVGARVISTSSDSWNRVITINKGSVAGLSVGMPVLSANGLIGQIESVSLYSSVVRLIVDEGSGVAAFLQTSRVDGVLSGSLDGVLYLDFVPLDVTVEPGDTVITSGTGGVYPKGIPIGEVTAVRNAPSDVYQTIIVRPISRVTSYEEVLVITGREAEITASGAADASGTTGTEGAAQSQEGGQGQGGSTTGAGE